MSDHPFIDNADRGKHAVWRYVLTLILAFIIQTFVIVAALLALVAGGYPLTELMASVQDPAHPILFFSTIGISFAALIAGVALGGVWLHKKKPSDYLGKWRWSLFAMGVLIWLALLLANTALDYALRPTGFRFSWNALVPLTVIVTCAALAVQTFAEEYIFRGYILQGVLKLTRHTWIAAIISGSLFGAMHIPNGLFQAASASLLGIALGVITIRTGSIAFGAGLHMINNIYGAVGVVSGADVFKGSPALIIQNTPELNMIDLGFMVSVLVMIIIWVYRRQNSRSEGKAV